MLKKYWISIICGAVGIGMIFSKIIGGDVISSLIVGSILVALALAFDFLKDKIEFLRDDIKKISSRVDIWVHEDRQNREEWRKLAEQLEEIVKELNSIRDPIEGKIALNGAMEVLRYKGLSYAGLTNMMDYLSKCTKFRGVAIYGPGEWMDPFWFAYLIAQAALLTTPEVDAKRFFIYGRDIVASPTWHERLNAIVQAVGQSIPAYLCILERAEEELKNQSSLKIFLEKLYSDYNNGQKWEVPSFIPLMDIIYIETSNEKICKWRNPGKEGEPEDLKPEEAKQLGQLLEPVYEKLEKIAKIKQKPEVA